MLWAKPEMVTEPTVPKYAPTIADAINVFDHWSYVKQILETHGESDDVIEKIGVHYRLAMVHGYKHGVSKWPR